MSCLAFEKVALDRCAWRTWFLRLSCAGCALLSIVFGSIAAENEENPDKLRPGLKVTFRAGTESDVVSRPNLWLYVPAGTSPSAFLGAGAFTAEWEGFVTLDLRSEYSFQADFAGSVRLELNGKAVLETNSISAVTASSRPVRLSKGTNSLRVTFTSPSRGDAFFRIQWASRGALPQPIPSNALSHAPDAVLRQSDRRRLGRELLIEHRCLKCHTGAFRQGPPDLAMDAPTFEAIGSRRRRAWLADWILDPKAHRSTARMPAMFHGANARADAEAVAAFLVSLTNAPAAPNAGLRPAATVEREAGKRLFEALHCIACHDSPDDSTPAAGRISLRRVSQKFAAGTLVAFLQKPEAHYAWIRMPNFKLTAEEARHLAAYLESPSHGSAAEPDPRPVEGEWVRRGKELVRTAGCLNCHTLGMENTFATKTFADLQRAGNWRRGCLAEVPGELGAAPRFEFSSREREALREFAADSRGALNRNVAVEWAERHTRLLNCRECHGKFDGFPRLEILGGKLKPEWAKAFIAGEVSDKPRPWLEARMPAFPAYASAVAQGLALSHGFAAETPPEMAVDPDAAAIGRKLVSAAGGFSCTACHAVGDTPATQGISEGAGINLAYSWERLLKPYFEQWVRNPLSMDPSTKMPVYFDEQGRSPLVDLYEGDGLKQIEAIWHYLRLGPKMPPPPMP